ncbi:hypothetical protein SULI_12780 [Saccharolobus solfataricus]|uniref:Uncharacterized protein n=3 Tax=Saccharolobus solfataricus TaxID=2287 RepID=Q97XF8_SACS2|nr:hypothetical protein [Saccharolobus solfataricus]AAK41976.1 Hypothetical protein SSO1784 [Saccharolobus solfataricus P2]AKA74649.1 hypothetical protein SULB_2522 [Saccharolobus solfataricus]AKA77343.1 hypothetical protein SULC_2517 [Saccharolobus solfataricus]AKA80034.1 hypothetical protein SULA_2519 [Saccharolobus solfataricus]AZF69113.1 hypothetical protein SULG_12780 [Saccharolobus solfataricus]
MKKHIRYIIDGYSTLREADIKNVLKSLLSNLDDDVRVSKKGYKISLSFRTPDNVRIMQCEEIDELLSRIGVMVTRIIVSSVITYEYEGAGVGATVGGIVGGGSTKRLDVGLLIAVLSGLAGYSVGKLIEKGEAILLSCEKRNGRWVRI